MRLRYPIGNSGQMIEFAPSVLARFDAHRQTRFWHCEAGGQLFARFSDTVVVVGASTGPRPTDFRTPISYRPDRKAEQAEIELMHADQWHYVGDWHTHPQSVPSPSGTDLTTIKSTFNKSEHSLRGMLIVIVGRQTFPAGLFVGICDGMGLHDLLADW